MLSKVTLGTIAVVIVVIIAVLIAKRKSLGMSPFRMLSATASTTTDLIYLFEIVIYTSTSTNASTSYNSFGIDELSSGVSTATVKWTLGTSYTDTLTLNGGSYGYYVSQKGQFYGRKVDLKEMLSSVSFTLPAGTTYYRVDAHLITSTSATKYVSTSQISTYYLTKNTAYTGKDLNIATMIPVYPTLPNTALTAAKQVKLKCSSTQATTSTNYKGYVLAAS